ncbi:MAG: hypothetical protein HQL67_09870 [Magnetococcales bacterium]|nr:hypothetical protein [Magnetococcales bacterium]
MIETPLLFLNKPWASWMFGEIILIWGFSSWLFFRIRYLSPLQQNLDSAIQVLLQHPDPKQFAENFQKIDNQLTENKLMAQAWRSFEKQLITVEESEVVRSTQQADHFFQAAPLIDDFLDLRYYRSMPVYLMTAGFLLSFAILITGLFSVTQEFGAGDVDQSQIVLGSFLNGVSFKFFPALIGVFTGLVFSWGQRRRYDEQTQQIVFFRNLLMERIDFSNLNGLYNPANADGSGLDLTTLNLSFDRVIKHLEQTMDGLKKKTVREVLAAITPLSDEIRLDRTRLQELQEESLDTLFTKISDTVKRQIEQGQETLNRATDRLDKKSESLDDKFSDLITDSLRPIIHSVQEEMTRLARDQEQILRRSLQEISSTTATDGLTVVQLDSVRQEMDRQMVRQGEKIEEGMNAVIQQLQSISLAGQLHAPLLSANTEVKTSRDSLIEQFNGRAVIDPIIALIQREGERFARQNDEVARKLFDETSQQLRIQLDEQTERLRQTSERLDRSAATLEENAGKFATQSLQLVAGALHQEGAHFFEKNERAMREALGEITSQIRAQVGETAEELVRASQQLNLAASSFGEKTEKVHQNNQDALLGAIIAEGSKIRTFLQEQPILEQITQALNTQSAQMAQSQSQALHKALSDIAVRGSDGQLSIEPLLATVKAESERILAHQGETIHTALAGVVTRLSQTISPKNITEAIQTQVGQLLRKQERLINEIADLNFSLSKDRIVETIQSETNRLASKQDLLSQDIAGLQKSLNPDQLIAHIKETSLQLTRREEDLNGAISSLKESLAPDQILQAVKDQGAELTAQLTGLSIDPILDALREQTRQLALKQSQALQQSLSEMAISSDNGMVTIDPLLVAIKSESERQFQQQETLIREAIQGLSTELKTPSSPDALLQSVQRETQTLAENQSALSRELALLNQSLASGTIIETIRTESDRLAKTQQKISLEIHGLNETLATDTIIDAIRQETRQLSQRQEALNGIVAGLNDSLSPDPILAAIKAESQQLNKRQDSLIGAMADLTDSIADHRVFDTLKTETNRLLNAVSSLSLEPILAALKQQGEQLAAAQSQSLQSVLGEVAIRGTDGQLTLDPLLAAVKASGENQLSRQSTMIREALQEAIHELSKILSPLPIIETLKQETDRLDKKHAAIRTDIAGLNATWDSERILATIQSEADRLSKKQDSLGRDLLNLNQSATSDQIIEVIRDENKQLSKQQQQLSTLISGMNDSLTPDRMIDQVKRQTALLLDRLSELSLEPVLVALKQQSDQFASNQTQALNETLSEIPLTGEVGETTIQPLLFAIQRASELQLQKQEAIIQTALSGIVSDLKSVISEDRIIESVQAEGDRLARSQESISRDIAGLNDALAPEQIIDVVRAEVKMLIKGQETTNSLVARLGDTLSADAVIEAFKSQTARLLEPLTNLSLQPVLTAIQEQGAQLAKNQSLTLKNILAEITVQDDRGEIRIDPLLAAVKTANLNHLESQGRFIQEAFSGVVAELKNSLSPKSVIEAMKIATDRLDKKQDALGRDIAGLNSALSADNLIESLKTETGRLAKKQDALGRDIASLNETLAPDRIIETVRAESKLLLKRQELLSDVVAGFNQSLTVDSVQEAIKSQTNLLVAQLSNLTLDPILAAMKDQSDRLILAQSHTLQNVLSDTTVNSDGQRNIDPVLAAVKAANEQQLARQAQLIRENLENAVTDLKSALSPEAIIEAMKIETGRLDKKQERLSLEIAGLHTTLASDQLLSAFQSEARESGRRFDALNRKLAELSESLSAETILATIKSQTDRLAKTQQVLSRDLTDLTEILSPDQVIETVKSQTSQLVKQLSDLSLSPILDALKEQSIDLMKNQHQAIQQAFQSVVVQSENGEMTLDPLLAAVKSESERILVHQSTQIHEAFSDMLLKVSNRFSPDDILQSIEKQTDRLLKKQAALKEDIAKLNESLDPDLIIDALKVETNRLAKKQDSFSHIVTDLSDRLSPETVVLAVKSQTDRLLDKIDDLSLKPVLHTLNEQGHQLAAEQTQALKQALTSLTAAAKPGEMAVEPILNAIETLDGQQQSRQEAVIRDALKQMTATLLEKLSPDNLLETIKTEIGSLAKKQELLRNDLIHFNDNLSPDSLVETVKLTTKQLLKRQESLTALVSSLHDSLSTESVLSAIHSQSAQIVNKISTLSLEPILDALKTQGELLSRNQSQTLHNILSEVAIRDGQGSPTIEPLLAAAKVSSQQQMLHQETIIRDTLNDAVARLSALLSPENLIKIIQAETQPLRQGQANLDRDLAQLHAALSPTDLIDSVTAQTNRLAKKQEALSLDISGLRSALSPESTLEAIHAQMENLSQQIANVSLQPVLDAVKEQGKQMIQSQSETLQNLLADISVTDGQGELTLEPILAAIKSSNERQISRQSHVIREAMDEAVDRLNQALSPQETIAVIRAQTARIEKQVSELPFAPIMEAIRVQGEQHSQSPYHELLDTLESFTNNANQGAQQIMEPLLAAIRSENERMLHHQGEQIRMALDALLTTLQQGYSLDSVIEVLQDQQAYQIKTQEKSITSAIMAALRDSSIEPLLHDLKRQGLQLANNQQTDWKSTLDDAVGTLTDRVTEDVGQRFKWETEQLMTNQQQVIQAELAGLSLNPILEVMNAQGQQLAYNQKRILQEVLQDIAVQGREDGVVLEPLIATIKGENERLLARQEEVINKAFTEILFGLAEVKEETVHLSSQLISSQSSDQPLLESVVRIVQAESARIIENQSQSLQELVGRLNNRDDGFDSGQNPVVSAVQEELALLGDRHENIIREAFAQATLESAALTSMDPLIDVVKTETAQLANVLQETIQDLIVSQESKEGAGWSVDQILQAVREQGALLAETHSQSVQEILREIQQSGRHDGTVNTPTINAIIEALQAEGTRWQAHQEESVRTTFNELIGGIGRLFSPETIIRTIKREVAQLSDLIEEGRQTEILSFEQIVSAMKDQATQLIEKQSRLLGETLENQTLQNDNSPFDLNAIVAAIKSQGDQLLQQQSAAMQKSLDQLSAQIVGSFSPELLIQTIKQEFNRVISVVTRDHGSPSVNLDPVISAIQNETILLAESLNTSLRAIRPEQTDTTTIPIGTLSLEPILEAVRQSSDRVMQQLESSKISDRILETLRSENDHLLDRLTQQVMITPMLEALQTQGEIISDQLSINLKNALSGSMIGGGDTAALDRVIDSVRTESANVVRQLSEKISLDPLMDSLESHLDRMAENQVKTLHSTFAEIINEWTQIGQSQPVNLDLIIRTVRQESAKLAETIHRQLSNSPMLEVIRSEMDQLAQRQSDRLEEILSQVATAAGGSTDIQPLAELIQSETHRLTQELSEQLSLEPILAAIKAESGWLAQNRSERLDAIASQVGESAGGSVDFSALLSAMKQETRQLTQTLAEQISLEPIFALVKEESNRIFQSQSKQLENAVTHIAQQTGNNPVNLQPLLQAIESESQNLFQKLSQNTLYEPVITAVKGEVDRLVEHYDPTEHQQELLDTVIAQGDRLSEKIETHSTVEACKTIEALVRQNLQQTHTLREVIHGAIDKLRQDLTPEKLLEIIKEETTRIASSLESVSRAPKPDPRLQKEAEQLSSEMVRRAIKSETSRLETLLNQTLQTTLSKRIDEKFSSRPQPPDARPTSKPEEPPAKPAHARQKPTLSLGQVEELVHWQPTTLKVEPQADPPYRMPETVKGTSLSGLQELMTQIGPLSAKGIDGKSLLELMNSMKLYVLEQFGKQSGHLAGAIQDLIDRIKQDTPLSNPDIISLLREIAHRSNQLMIAHNPEAQQVLNLDKGFLKTANILQKQVQDLSATKPGSPPAKINSDTVKKSVFQSFIAEQEAKVARSAAPLPVMKTVPIDDGTFQQPETASHSQEKHKVAVSEAPVRKKPMTTKPRFDATPIPAEKRPAQELMWSVPAVSANQIKAKQAATSTTIDNRLSPTPMPIIPAQEQKKSTATPSKRFNQLATIASSSVNTEMRENFFNSFLEKRQKEKQKD